MTHRTDQVNKWQVLGTVGIGTFIMALNSSMINVALPFIAEYFQVSVPVVEWVVMVYLLMISTLLLTFGRLGDIYGFRRIYLLGMAIFTVSSFFCGLASTVYLLTFFRVFQGLSAAMVMAIGPAILTAAFGSQERGKALGLHGVFVASALGFGPTLGGLLVNITGWRFLFYINVPLCAISIFWAWLVLAPASRNAPSKRQDFDLTGAATLFIALGSLLLALSHGQEWVWSSRAILGLLFTACIFFLFFIRQELRCKSPMIKLHFFKNRLFAAAAASAVLNFLVQYIVVFLLPFFLKEVFRFDAARSGFLLSTFPLAILVASPLSGVLSDRIGSRGLSSFGMAISAVSLIFLSRLTPSSVYLDVIWPLILLGLGNGIFQSPNSSALMSSVPYSSLGVAGGILATARNVGMVLGVALGGMVFNHRLHIYFPHMTDAEKLPEVTGIVFSAAFRDAMLVGVVVALLGMAASLVRGAKGATVVSSSAQDHFK